jgi:uncharacterized membrane protein YfcA
VERVYWQSIPLPVGVLFFFFSIPAIVVIMWGLESLGAESSPLLSSGYEKMESLDVGVLFGGCLCLFLSCLMASAGGIGGGGLNVPIFVVILGFQFKTATILSLCTVLGNYISQIYVNWDRSHPLMITRPLIYFEIILVLVPAQLGGNNIGVIIAEIFPDTILLIVAVLVVIYALIKTTLKAKKLYKKETLVLQCGDDSMKRPLVLNPAEQRLVIEDDDDDEDDNPILLHNSGHYSNHVQIALENGANGGPEPEEPLRLDKYLNSRSTGNSSHHKGGSNHVSSSGVRLFDYSRDSFSSLVPAVIRDYYIIGALVAVWAGYGAFYVSMQVAAEKCSTPYYILLACSFIPLAITVYFGLRYVSANQIEDSHLILEGDVDFSKLSFIPPMMAFFIGILCSLLGIGGGELMGPLLLSLQVLPLVSSATTSFMSFMSSSSNILHYAILGKIDYKWAILCFCIGLLGGVSGRSLALYLVAKYRRASITAMALAFMLGTSVLLLVYDIASSEFDLSIHNFCKS